MAQVALEAGNSPQIIFRNYRERVKPADALNWLALEPENLSRGGIRMPDANRSIETSFTAEKSVRLFDKIMARFPDLMTDNGRDHG